MTDNVKKLTFEDGVAIGLESASLYFDDGTHADGLGTNSKQDHYLSKDVGEALNAGEH